MELISFSTNHKLRINCQVNSEQEGPQTAVDNHEYPIVEKYEQNSEEAENNADDKQNSDPRGEVKSRSRLLEINSQSQKQTPD